MSKVIMISNKANLVFLKFKFLFESDSKNILIRFLELFLISLFGFPPPPAVKFSQRKRFNRFKTDPSLTILGKNIGLTSTESQHSLKNHDKYLDKIAIHKFDIWMPLLYSCLFTLISISIFPIIWHIKTLSTNFITFAVVSTIVIILLSIVLFYYLVFIKAMLYTIYINLAESLSARELIYIILELRKSNTIDDINLKTLLRERIKFLAKITRILGIKYSKLEPRRNRRQTKQHYADLASTIEEKISWINKPRKTTLYDLRQYFLSLTDMYIEGYYGEHEWTEYSVASIKQKITLKILFDTSLEIIAKIINVFQKFKELIK